MQSAMNMSSKRVTGEEPKMNLDSKVSKAESELPVAQDNKDLMPSPDAASENTVAASEQVAEIVEETQRLSLDETGAPVSMSKKRPFAEITAAEANDASFQTALDTPVESVKNSPETSKRLKMEEDLPPKEDLLQN